MTKRPTDAELRAQAERRRGVATHYGEHAVAADHIRKLEMAKFMAHMDYPRALDHLKKSAFSVAQALKNGALTPDEAWAKLTALFDEERVARGRVAGIQERIDQVKSIDQAAVESLAVVLGRDALPDGVVKALPESDREVDR
jgi:hypothetical protein